MCADRLFSVDRIEEDMAVLVAGDGTTCAVSLAALPDVQVGDMYRMSNRQFRKDLDAKTARREQVQNLQNRFRQPR